MSTLARRKFFEQLSILMQKQITVTAIDGKTYSGLLEGYNPESMGICLSDARDEQGNVAHRLFLNGSIVAQIRAVEKPFDLRALADRLEKVFPRMIKLYEDIGIILVMDRIRVSEKGIVEGTGPAAERVQRVYDEFIKESQA